MIWIDAAFKVLTVLIGLGIFGAMGRLVIWAIRMEPRIESIEKETLAHGAMIQQFTATIARIEGRLQDGDGKWDQGRKDKTSY